MRTCLSRWLSTSLLLCSIAAAIENVWSPWSEWTSCSVTCGRGQQQRFRGCQLKLHTTESGSCKGGSYLQTEECDSGKRCAVDGGWSQWSTWSQCTQSCGEGKRQRFRSCSQPIPLDGGRQCEGGAHETQKCFELRQCPRDGGWSSWSQWSLCSVTCGEGGNVNRYRSCNNPQPAFGGRDCKGLGHEVRECRADFNCPLNGQWSEWSDWTPCSETCGVGESMRTRRCDNPPPLHGGRDCDRTEAAEVQIKRCRGEIPFCPVDGGWSEWSDWDSCHSPDCKFSNIPSRHFRQRSCNTPLPQHNGTMCQGSFLEAALCHKPINCKVDGGWSEWSAWTCTKFVGTRRRKCDNPVPSNGGRSCRGPAVEFHTRDDEQYSETCPQFPDDDVLDEASGHGDQEEEEEEEYEDD